MFVAKTLWNRLYVKNLGAEALSKLAPPQASEELASRFTADEAEQAVGCPRSWLGATGKDTIE